MCDRPKIHVFLGAPAPSSCPDSVSETGLEGAECPPARWAQLEVSWRDGRLRPAAEENAEADRLSSGGQDDDWNGTAPQGRQIRLTSEHKNSDHHRAAQTVPSADDSSASVHEYLDSCFPAAQPEQPDRPRETEEPDPPQGSTPSPPAARLLSIQTQYLTTWTLSQALVMRGRREIQLQTSPEKTPPPRTPPKRAQASPCVSSSTPELFSPATPSLGASAELFSPPDSATWAREGGVVLDATADGVLCSQEAEQHKSTPPPPAASTSTSPDFKRARIFEEVRTEAAVSDSRSSFAAAASLQSPTTLLVKSGPSAGTFVPLASIVVTDQSGVEMKAVLWRQAAFWVLTVNPGDILLITGLQVIEDKWRGETVLQSTFGSKLLNLGRITASSSPPAPQRVDARALSCLCGFLRERRPLLVSPQLRPPQDLNRLPYATLRSLRANTLVHALLRATHTHISTAWRAEAESRSRSALQRQAVVTVEQADGQQGALLLWGAALDWLARLSRDKAAVWDVRVLLVRDGLTSDLPELHSTPWSSIRRLDAADRRAQDFLLPRQVPAGSSSLELDLDTLLSQKYSGNVELRVQIFAFQFLDSSPSQNAPQPVLDSATSPADILAALSGDVTYAGCGRCSAELGTDANGIYGTCYPCLPHTAVRRYYRSGVLTVSGRGNNRVRVQVPPVPLQKVLEAPPDKLQRSSAPGSQVKHIQVAAERIQSLLYLPRKTFVISVRSLFLCDENSVPITQELTLLDLQFPG